MRLTLKCLTFALAALVAAGAAQADDPFSQSVWMPGQVAAFSAIPPNPGLTVTVQPYYYSGEMKGSKNLLGLQFEGTYKTDYSVGQLAVSYAPVTKLWNGQMNFGLMTGYGHRSTSVDFSSLNGVEQTVTGSDSVSSALDLYPYASITWSDQPNHLMLYLMGAIETAPYDAQRLSNLGLGHNAVDFGVAYTYLDRNTGWEASVLTGATYNAAYAASDRFFLVGDEGRTNLVYQNGWDGHTDFSVSKFVNDRWSLGGVAYAYYQFTHDTLGGKEVQGTSRVAGIGPQASYVFRVKGLEWTASVRGYYEFWGQNRPEGWSIFATLTMPLGHW